MNSDKKFSRRSLVRSAGLFGSVTMVSRVLGLVRDVLSAGLFGTTAVWDSFVIAFTIPNMFRMLLGEGALAGAFVPVFTEYLHKKGESEAWHFANRVITLLSLVLVAIVIAGWCGCGLILQFEISSRLRDILILSMILLPYLFFICNVGLLMGILNTFYHFFLPAFNPIILNIVLISFILGLNRLASVSLGTRAVILSCGVIVGGILQFASHFMLVKRKGLSYKFSFDLSDRGVKKVWTLMLPALVGLSITQLNLMVDRFLAYLIGAGAASFLYYSNRLIQLPVGVFGVALASTSFPLLTHNAVSGKMDEFKDNLSHVIRMMLFIAIPATFGLIILSKPIIRMIFEHNEFDSFSTSSTAVSLIYYSIGLGAFCCNKIIIRAFYSLQDTKTPVRIGLFSLCLNVILNLLLMIPLKHGGLALSTSITAFVSFFLLLGNLKKKIGGFLDKSFFRSIRVSAVSSLMMMIAVYWGYSYLATIFKVGLWGNIIVAGGGVLIGSATYFLSSYLLKSEEIDSLFRMFLKK